MISALPDLILQQIRGSLQEYIQSNRQKKPQDQSRYESESEVKVSGQRERSLTGASPAEMLTPSCTAGRGPAARGAGWLGVNVSRTGCKRWDF